MKKKIIITGAHGIVGTILTEKLGSEFEILPLDKKEVDLTDYKKLFAFIDNNTDVIIHLAWDPKPIYENGMFNNDNFVMMHNIFEAAVQKKIKRVVIASSVHANEYRKSLDTTFFVSGGSPPLHGSQGRSKRVSSLLNKKIPNNIDWPTSIYGAAKLYFEALGRYYSAYHGLEVVVIRLGGVNSEDSPTAKDEPDYEKVFLSHDDLITFVKSAIEKKNLENNYWSFYAVSKK